MNWSAIASTWQNISPADLGIFVYTPTPNVGVPTVNDYTLTDPMFDSHTTGGITYTWRRGNNW
jgi:hypothetical protein